MKEQELIEKYLQHKLTGPERQAFENRLANEPALAKEVSDYRKDELIIRSAVRQQLRTKAAMALKDHQQKVSKRFALRRSLSIAAGIFFLIVAGYFIFQQMSQPVAPETLFAQHFELVAAPAVRDGTGITDQQWSAALDSYSKQKYPEAIAQFQSLLNAADFNKQDQAKLLLGISYLMEKKPEEAATTFKSVSKESSYQQDAEWYLALAYLQAGDIARAEKQLQIIAATPRHFKQKEAQGMLEEL